MLGDLWSLGTPAVCTARTFLSLPKTISVFLSMLLTRNGKVV